MRYFFRLVLDSFQTQRRGISQSSRFQQQHQGHYTPITKQLWLDRIASVSKQASITQGMPLTHKPPEVTSVTYPFSSNSELKELYRNPWNYIRIGCILEDLDSLAGNVAFQHCAQPGSPAPLLVTASVDEIQLHRQINIEKDVQVTGRVVWTGTSSLDIQMQLWQEPDPISHHIHHIHQYPMVAMVALFSFVHLDPVSKRPAPLVQLLPQSDQDRELTAQRQALADARRASRQAQASGSKVLVPLEARKWMTPLLNEARVLKELPALSRHDAVPISHSSLENTFVTQPQHQNMHGRVFGGFLMRRAYELAFATAYMFLGGRPSFIKVDEVSFKRPVDIGDLLRLRSRILHTTTNRKVSGTDKLEGLLFVEVEASVTKPEQLSVANSNTFIFVFASRTCNQPLKRMLPTTEEEALAAFECSLAAEQFLS
ncbi:hypothetical protein CEUSTIGMA_g9600.t1 [Chlamydomonas eustigma]|uniref:HotDog ACOT-type domain-containing protein n=1 Tax=Chlamydomonas eustigma TaxID=1157962 RepID=A0A250XGX7_9CHLO|nr:hypothetical protein CEUSTIGMA_g9600.t1 [Chlamydomonas eustigma]|eukprot:GAX82172.1 hypothetical protein CEUSTIGMA_g9600.t1 [Chlamydomonas eustigma]